MGPVQDSRTKTKRNYDMICDKIFPLEVLQNVPNISFFIWVQEHWAGQLWLAQASSTQRRKDSKKNMKMVNIYPAHTKYISFFNHNITMYNTFATCTGSTKEHKQC